MGSLVQRHWHWLVSSSLCHAAPRIGSWMAFPFILSNELTLNSGVRPTSNTGFEHTDAFVWVKPGGECDGTSDTSAARYDYHCGLSDALQPAPEAGQWFQAYFEQLLTNANPPF